jgi:hypothetical protein
MNPHHEGEYRRAAFESTRLKDSGIGVAVVWLAFYVLIIIGSATANFRSQPMLEISAAARTD